MREGASEGAPGLLQPGGDAEGPARHNAEIGVCGTCMDARGIADGELTEGAKRSTLEELTNWTVWAEKTLVF